MRIVHSTFNKYCTNEFNDFCTFQMRQMRCHAARVQLEVHLESRVSRYDGLSGWPNHFCLFFDGPPRPLFISFVFSKNVHPIFGAGIQTHDLLNMSPPITTRPGLPPNSAYVIIIIYLRLHLFGPFQLLLLKCTKTMMLPYWSWKQALAMMGAPTQTKYLENN